jgi:hypothetical protein
VIVRRFQSDNHRRHSDSNASEIDSKRFHGDHTPIAWRLRGDFAAIAQRLRSDFAAIANRWRSDGAAMAQRLRSYCVTIAKFPPIAW